jgi:hypothetical protein
MIQHYIVPKSNYLLDLHKSQQIKLDILPVDINKNTDWFSIEINDKELFKNDVFIDFLQKFLKILTIDQKLNINIIQCDFKNLNLNITKKITE